MNDPFKTFGPPELCTWRYAPGVCRFQTTCTSVCAKALAAQPRKIGGLVGQQGILAHF